MSPAKEPGNAPAVPSSMSWAQFAAAKQVRQRRSRYLPFVLAMKEKTVYDATESFPKIAQDTLRSGLYGQARKTGRKLAMITQDGKLYVALREIETGKVK